MTNKVTTNYIDFHKTEILALKAGTKKRHIITALMPTVSWNGCVPLGGGEFLLASNKDDFYVQCPLGGSGNRVLVREKWTHGTSKNSECSIYYEADEDCRVAYSHDNGDGDFSHVGEITLPWAYPKSWKPSEDMPRGASRFCLEMTKVRLRLMGDISRDEAELYGVEKLTDGWWLDYTCKYNNTAQGVACPLSSLRGMWNTLNPFCRWADRAWVWDIDFELVDEKFDAYRDLD